MFLTKMKIAMVALVLGFTVMGATVFTYRTAASQGDKPLIAGEQPALPPKQEPEGARTQAARNLSMLMGALQKYHDDPRHGRLPPAVILGKDGNGGVPHSWRVEILPYLGEKALYDAYRFNEPWDSKHNQADRADACGVSFSPRQAGLNLRLLLRSGDAGPPAKGA